MEWEREVSEKKQPFKIHFEKAKTKKWGIRWNSMLLWEKLKLPSSREVRGLWPGDRFAVDAVVAANNKNCTNTVLFNKTIEIGRYGSGQVSAARHKRR